MITLLYDTDLRRPGCVLLQAAALCNYRDLYRAGFDERDWLVTPTPGMKRVAGSLDEWKRVAREASRE